MHILVADQNSEHRQRLGVVLQSWGHIIQEALAGREVVDLCRKKCPDLLLVDATLSGQPGTDIVRQVRQTGGHASWVPIILMGNSVSDADMLQGAEAGADDFLQKPISDARLTIKVSSALRHLNLKEEVFKVAHELVVVNRALQKAITQDVLTGIGNSDSFEEALEHEWFTAKRLNVPLSLILLNLDFFQAYNQAYGAMTGDETLKKIAEALKSVLPSGDVLLARTTGETFAVLLPKIGGDEAFKIGEKLHKAIDDLKIPHKNSGCSDHVTASFGVATAEPNHFTKPWDLKDAADFGLYQAKHHGRNRGVIAPAAEVIK